jgi:hypothetical protein
MPLTSTLSATMIGIQNNNAKGDPAAAAYKKEAKNVSEFLTGIHHSRKLPSMQINYSETVKKLSKCQSKVSVALEPPKPAEPAKHSKNYEQEGKCMYP